MKKFDRLFNIIMEDVKSSKIKAKRVIKEDYDLDDLTSTDNDVDWNAPLNIAWIKDIIKRAYDDICDLYDYECNIDIDNIAKEISYLLSKLYCAKDNEAEQIVYDEADEQLRYYLDEVQEIKDEVKEEIYWDYLDENRDLANKLINSFTLAQCEDFLKRDDDLSDILLKYLGKLGYKAAYDEMKNAYKDEAEKILNDYDEEANFQFQGRAEWITDSCVYPYLYTNYFLVEEFWNKITDPVDQLLALNQVMGYNSADEPDYDNNVATGAPIIIG